MKSDQELIKIWEGQAEINNYKAQGDYENLNSEEKSRLFDLIK